MGNSAESSELVVGGKGIPFVGFENGGTFERSFSLGGDFKSNIYEFVVIRIIGKSKEEYRDLIVSVSEDKFLRVFSLKKGLEKSFKNDFPLVSISHHSSLLFCGDSDGCILLFSSHNIEFLRKIRIAKNFSVMKKIIFLRNQNLRRNNDVNFFSFCSSGMNCSGMIYLCRLSSNHSKKSKKTEEVVVESIDLLINFSISCAHRLRIDGNVALFGTYSEETFSSCIYEIEINSPTKKINNKRLKKIHSKYDTQLTCISSYVYIAKSTKAKNERIVCSTLEKIILSNRNGNVIRTFLSKSSHCENLLIVSDLSVVILGQDDGNISFFHLPSEKEIKKSVNVQQNDDIKKISGTKYGVNESHNGTVFCIRRLSKNRFVTSSADGKIIVWKVNQRNETLQHNENSKSEFISFIDNL